MAQRHHSLPSNKSGPYSWPAIIARSVLLHASGAGNNFNASAVYLRMFAKLLLFLLKLLLDHVK